MKAKIKIPLLILLFIGIAVYAYFGATGSISSNYAYRSVLKDSAPAAGEPLGAAATQKLVIVLIDGLRYDTSLDASVMPFLNDLRANGASAKMHSQAPSYSEPGYSTILTGAWPEINDGPALNLDYEEIPTFTQDNLFSAAHDAGFTTAISAYYWFEKLVPQTAVDNSFYTPGDDAQADSDVINAAMPWLQNPNVQVVLVHIDQVDYAGHHQGGPQSENWNIAAKKADDLLLQVVNQINLESDTVVVLSDHGHIMIGGHGGQDPDVLVEPFVIAGAGAKTGATAEINMVDVAPTLAALLGARLPASTQGIVRTDLIQLSPAVQQALPAAVAKQQAALVSAYTTALGTPADGASLNLGDDVAAYQALMSKAHDAKLRPQRVLRAVPAALLLALGITLLLRKRKSGAAGWVIGALVYVALFTLRYAVLSKKTFSLSSVTGQMDLILYTATTAAAAFLIAYLVNILLNKLLSRKPAEAVLNTFGLGFTVVFALMIPVALSFVLNGAVVTWTLPDYFTSFLSLLALIQILIVSAVALLFGGISALLTLKNRKNVAK
jgi:hypothetical protein